VEPCDQGKKPFTTLEDFSSHKLVLLQAQKVVVCGVICEENCLEIKYNPENL
jgi:hypothetical protein